MEYTRCDFSCFFPRKSDHVPGDTLRSEKTQKKTKKVRNFPRARHWNSNHFEVVSFHNFHDQDSHSTATATKSSFENNRQRQVFAWLAHLNKSWSFVLFLLPFKKCWKHVLSNMLRSVKALWATPALQEFTSSHPRAQEGRSFQDLRPKTIKKPTLDVKSCRSKPLNQSWIHPNRLKCNLMYHVQQLRALLKGNFSSFPFGLPLPKKIWKKKHRIREFLRDQVSHWHFTWRR